MLVYDSGIAQLVEHLTVNQGVVSSSLTTGVVGGYHLSVVSFFVFRKEFGMELQIVQARLWALKMPLLHPFASSEGTVATKDALLLELTDQSGRRGFGECSAFATPFYTAEFQAGAAAFLQHLVLPRVVGHGYHHPDDFDQQVANWQGNQMAKAAVNCALWDLYAQRQNQPLAKALGGERAAAEAGISLGIQASPAALVEKVAQAVAAGYRRVKVKIKPGHDLADLRAVRAAFPTLMLMADANSAYQLTDAAHLRQLDELKLTMLEQPLAPGDLIEHAALQAQLQTPLCLDESITTLADAQAMVQLQAGKVINLKVARVGGLSAAKQILAFAQQAHLDCWVGGMLDSGVARAASLALATLPGITLPNDLSASTRFYATDIIDPPLTLQGSQMLVPAAAGLGVEINWPYFAQVATLLGDFTMN